MRNEEFSLIVIDELTLKLDFTVDSRQVCMKNGFGWQHITNTLIYEKYFFFELTPHTAVCHNRNDFHEKDNEHCLINAIHCGFQNHFISFLFYEYFSIEWSRRSSSDVYKCRLATVGRCGHRVVEIKMIINSGPHTLQS